VTLPDHCKDITAGAPCSRDSHLQGVYALQGIYALQGVYALQGTPAKRYQKLISGEFQRQHEIVIASCKSCGETDYQAVIHATVGFTRRLP
jgi:hypothetical protein